MLFCTTRKPDKRGRHWRSCARSKTPTRVSTFTIARCRKKACWDSNTATQSSHNTHWSCGKRSLEILETARRRSSINTSLPRKTSGNRLHDWEFSCHTVTKDRDRSIQAHDSSDTSSSVLKTICRFVIRQHPRSTFICCDDKYGPAWSVPSL